MPEEAHRVELIWFDVIIFVPVCVCNESKIMRKIETKKKTPSGKENKKENPLMDCIFSYNSYLNENIK